VGAIEVTEWIHPIGTQREHDVPRLITKLRELGIETLPLLAIRGVLQTTGIPLVPTHAVVRIALQFLILAPI
jgi:hypothetical protein